MIEIVIGTHPKGLKVEAVKAAVFALSLDASVDCKDVGSGVNPQPYGQVETLRGALNRARAAQLTNPRGLSFGIENGLIPQGDKTYDQAFMALITPDARILVLRSGAVLVPDHLVEASRASGWSITAGALQAALDGGDPADPQRVWSGGKTDRKTLLTETATKALLAVTRHWNRSLK